LHVAGGVFAHFLYLLKLIKKKISSVSLDKPCFDWRCWTRNSTKKKQNIIEGKCGTLS